jgi:hypothetical protein
MSTNISNNLSMNGLKVYFAPEATTGVAASGVFYSRRGEGPYYRWRYEESLDLWRVRRATNSEFLPRTLSTASWRDVPASLKARLGEHYLD